MVKHVLTVCVFCFICATHSPCASHGQVSGGSGSPVLPYYDDTSTGSQSRAADSANFVAVSKAAIGEAPQLEAESRRRRNPPNSSGIRSRRDAENRMMHVRQLFRLYGDGDSITVDGFQRLLAELHVKDNVLTRDCVDKRELMHASKNGPALNEEGFSAVCPTVLFGVLTGFCENKSAVHQQLLDPVVAQYSESDDAIEQKNRTMVWIYSLTAVIIISLCGVLGLAIIPVMQKKFYQPMLQFLVALAVGTLTGDALLHLLPHAMTGGSHGHHGSANTVFNDTMLTSDAHVHDDAAPGGAGGHGHGDNIWKGSVAMLGLVLFFLMERIIMLVAKWRKSQQLKNKQPTRLKVMDSNKSTSVTNAADKQCKHKYSSFPYCYDEIKMIDAPTEAAHSINFVRIPHTGGSDNQSHHHHAHHHHPHHHHNHNSDHHSHEHHRHDVGEHLTELDNQSPAMSLDVGELDCLDCRMHKQHELTTPATAHVTSHHNGKILREKVDERNENTTSVGAAAGAVCGDVTERNRMLDATDKDDEVEEEGRQHGGETDRDSVEYTVILREHHTGHHGHSHSHGHVHAAPNSMSAVAWMVIMGDGLHNFTDGMAIGAAFSDDITGGFSTALAVFCHELPHELGDFAMLLKAGMSMRQALFYNLMSSVLCVAGNIFGIWLGNTPEATSWVFAAAAGMFLYIALVDMIPELSSGHDDVDDGSTLMQCVLHLGGLLVGFGIMMLIACYEHELTHVFNNAL